MSLFTKIIDIQKLREAWQRVKKNKPAAGADSVTYEMYDDNLKENIKELNGELLDGKYECLPVKVVTIFRGEKSRDIALYSMRDKVLQQSMAQELADIYDRLFSDVVFAYRPERSALIALEEIESNAKNGVMKWVLKLDIRHFFDEIDQDILKNMLKKEIKEEDVIDLIMTSACARSVNDEGEILEKERGIHQGSSLAPVLSNIYLMDFDHDMEERCKFYVRYADDMLCMSAEKDELEQVLEFVKIRLKNLNLRLNEDKTELQEISSGFEFLGYCFDDKGKTITEKAEDSLLNRLEEMWFENRSLDINEKLKKGSQILDGWEQYFRGDREVNSVYEYAVVLFMVQKKQDTDLKEITRTRHGLRNYDMELACWLAAYRIERGEEEEALFEYEDVLDLSDADKGKILQKKYIPELLSALEKLVSSESKEAMEEAMQIYSDCCMFNKAAVLMERLGKTVAADDKKRKPVISGLSDDDKVPNLDGDAISAFMGTFVGREDTYATEEVDRNGRRSTKQVPEPLTESVVRMHLAGTLTVATYVQRSNSTARFLVIDVDISKHVFLSEGDSEETLMKYMQKAAEKTADIMRELNRMGLTGYVEESGSRGYHIWILFSEWIPVRYINMLTDIIEEKTADNGNEIAVEFFPNKTRVKNNKFGQALKLPLGIHVKSGRRSRFLTGNFEPVEDQAGFIADMASFNAAAVKKILGKHRPPEEVRNTVENSVDKDLSGFDIRSEGIRVILENCNLMRYLCQKAKNTGYLTHFERLSLLYVFGHMGDAGHEFLHHIMGFTLNYQYHVTQKFISRCPEKPVSCIKLRDQYKRITAEYGCSCNFRKIKNCYPSPVIHAIKDSEDMENHPQAELFLLKKLK